MWSANDSIEFSLVNSHEKTGAVRDTSLRETLRTRLLERLRNSKNFLLIATSNTKLDTDWVPFEISQAIDQYELPIIAAYPDYEAIFKPADLAQYWPNALAMRIHNQSAKVIHVPFRMEAIKDAISTFSPTNLPPNGLWYYSKQAHQNWGYL